MAAPYGRHGAKASSGWGVKINAKLAWFFMESPVSSLSFVLLRFLLLLLLLLLLLTLLLLLLLLLILHLLILLPF